MAQVPVEVFAIITSYLSIADVRALRLVCRDFEAKVSAQFFRNVVVPFGADLSTRLHRDVGNSIQASDANVFSDGMRIFETFAPRILRFALSLELDEDILAYPPVKPVQEAIPAFWGIYRWPHKSYQRYTYLASLEQTADKTHVMEAALRCLTNVCEFGLCCDSGLGFLSGPDTQARRGLPQQPIFSTVDWRRHNRSSHMTYIPTVTVANFNWSSKDQNQPAYSHPLAFKKGILETMVTEAGYVTSQTEDAVQTLLDTEGTSLSNIELEEDSFRSPSRDAELRRQGEALNLRRTRYAANYGLIPAFLTLAQKEMLLDLECAHRAMLQSFVLAVVNISFNDCFDNVTTFTIAKIPSCHLHIFSRDDIWKAIPSLRNVSLGVIADWRELVATGPGNIVDRSISPVDSVGKVFQLLNDYVGKYRNIESIHFEWICGGEFGSSTYQRNAYILPAPFYHRAELMGLATVVRDGTSNLLQLPYVKHLSLKNCWSSPHILLQAIRQFALVSLQKLELESVSLSGPPTMIVQAPLIRPLLPPINQELIMALHDDDLPASQAAYQAALNGDLRILLQRRAPPPPSSEPQPSHDLDQPDLLSWAGLIDHFSPGIKVRKLVAEETGQDMDAKVLAKAEAVDKYIPQVAELREDEKRYHLRHLAFRSCGYVSVDARFLHTRALFPLGRDGLAVMSNDELRLLMQTCDDNLLARISPFIKGEERAILNAFGMKYGWKGVYDEHVINEAKHVGQIRAGQGRFSGDIKATDEN